MLFPISMNYNTNQIKNSILCLTPNKDESLGMLTYKISESFNTNIYHRTVYKNLNENTVYDLQIFNGTLKDQKIKNFISYPYDVCQFKLGDYISYTDDSGIYQVWLITKIDQTNEFEINGELKQCVYNLSWQNSIGEIIRRWCVIEEYSVGDGLDISNQIRAVDGIYKIKLSFDSETKQIKENKRFLIDAEGIYPPHAYKVTTPNMITQNYSQNGNIVTLIVVKDTFNPKLDNSDLMLANYFVPTDINPPSSNENYSIIKCSNPLNQISIGGSTRTLSPIFYDNVNTINTSIIANWSYVLPLGYENQFIVSFAGNDMKIKVLDNNYLIGKSVSVTVSDNNSNYSSSTILTIIAS